MRWYLQVLKKYATFRGRASRKEFWSFFLIHILVAVLLRYADHPVLFFTYCWATLPAYLAVSVRRLQDANFRGWWQLLASVPLGGFLLLLVFHLLKGTPGPNRYGPNPKTEAAVQSDSPLSPQHEAGLLRQKSTDCFIVCAAYLSLGPPILFILWGLTYAYHSWPVYQAQIVRNEIVPAQSSQGKQGYEVRLQAAFVVDGDTITSEIALWNASYADAARQAAAFPVGSGQAVHYNPRIRNPHPVMASRDNQNRQQFHKVVAALLVPLVGGPIAGLLGIHFFLAARASKQVLAATA